MRGAASFTPSVTVNYAAEHPTCMQVAAHSFHTASTSQFPLVPLSPLTPSQYISCESIATTGLRSHERYFTPWSLWLALGSTVFLSHGRSSIRRSSFSNRLDTNNAVNGHLPSQPSHYHEQWPIPCLCTAHPLQRPASSASRHVDCGAEGTSLSSQRAQEEDETARTAGGTDISTDRGGIR